MVGSLLGFLPLAINKPHDEFPVWMVAAVVIGSLTFMGAISAAGSLALARQVKSGSTMTSKGGSSLPPSR